jgi:nitrile hydratase
MSVHVHDHERSAAISQRVKSLIARLQERGFTSERQLDEMVESFLLHAGPQNGFRIVARAWANFKFKERLMQNANEVEELGVDLSHWAPVRLHVVENTPTVHNLIVCTLCSCYPIALLGPSPSWYEASLWSSVLSCPPRRRSAFGIVPRKRATWFCRRDPPEPRTFRNRTWHRSLRETA